MTSFSAEISSPSLNSVLSLVEWRNILLPRTNADQTTLLTKCCTFQFLKILSRILFLQSNTDSRFFARICRLLEPCRYRYSSTLPRSRACRKRKNVCILFDALVCHDSRITCQPSFPPPWSQSDCSTNIQTNRRTDRPTDRMPTDQPTVYRTKERTTYQKQGQTKERTTQ